MDAVRTSFKEFTFLYPIPDFSINYTMKLQLAGCLIENAEGKILLLHRNTPERKQWETPGGKIEEGENSIAAAVREVKEELGIEVEIIDEIGRKDFKEDNCEMGYVWFKAKIVSGEPKPMEEKHDEVKYFSWEELKSMGGLSLNTKNLVEHHFSV